jgi:phage shock protein A
MKLFTRVQTLITAQLHEVAESFENPELMLKQTIRDMEAALQRTIESTARAIGGEKRLQRQLAEIRILAEHWRESAVRFVKSGDDPGARTALARQFEQARIADGLAAQVAHSKQANGRLRRQIDLMRGRLAEAKGNLASLIARQRSAEAQRHFATAHGRAESSFEAFNGFEELSRRVADVEAEAEAIEELRAGPPDEVPFDRDIETELQKLKNECAAAGEPK